MRPHHVRLDRDYSTAIYGFASEVIPRSIKVYPFVNGKPAKLVSSVLSPLLWRKIHLIFTNTVDSSTELSIKLESQPICDFMSDVFANDISIALGRDLGFTRRTSEVRVFTFETLVSFAETKSRSVYTSNLTSWQTDSVFKFQQVWNWLSSLSTIAVSQ